MFSFDGKIRFSEADKERKLRLTSLINYFQDCSTFHSESLGQGFETLMESGKGWVLNSWQIVVNRYPVVGEEVCTQTWPTGFESLYGTRNFRMCTKAGEVLAYANSIWVFMDMKKGRPMRPTEEEIAAYICEPPMEMEVVSRKIELPKESEEAGVFTVLRGQIDTNDHMNNSQYVQLAQEVLPEKQLASKIRVEYKKSAVLGDTIHAKLAVEEERTAVVLADDAGKAYAVVEFK